MRVAYTLLLIVTVVLGLLSREQLVARSLPHFVVAYAGDTLWAAMIVWLLALVWVGARTRTVALSALALSAGVELSQLAHPPWLDALRATRLGALVLGQGFLWSDLVCYAAGFGAAALLDRMLVHRRVRASACVVFNDLDASPTVESI